MNEAEILYKDLAKILNQNGFACELNKNFIDEQLTTGLFACRKGRAMGIFPFGDYIFVHFDDFKSELPETMMDLHQKARKYVNSLYRLPKAMRWTVPNIASLYISSNGFLEEIKKMAKKGTRSLIGGEIHGIYLFDLQKLDFISQGLNFTYIMGGMKMDFKNVNPQNRMFHLMNEIADSVFSKKTEPSG